MELPSSLSLRQARRWQRILWWLLGVVVGGYVLLAASVWWLSWSDSSARTILRFVPLPAALIGWQPVSASTYLENYAAIAYYRAKLHARTPTAFPSYTAGQNRQSAMDKTIRDATIFRLAKASHVAITDLDVEQAFSAQLVQGGSREATTKAIAELYGWTPDQFKEHVLRVAVAQEKLREQLSFNDTLNTSSRHQAEEVVKLVHADGADFSALAKQYSEDVYGPNGGDLGWVKQGEQAKELDDVAFTIKVGETSDLIHTKFGFHIIKVLERKEVDGLLQAHLAQIFVAAPSVDSYIATALKARSVRIFMPGLSWNRSSGQTVID